MRAALMFIAVGACFPTPPLVQPGFDQPGQCGTAGSHVEQGVSFPTKLSWSCPAFGEDGDARATCARTITRVRAWCSEDACPVTELVRSATANSADATVEITPSRWGRISLYIELLHANGARDLLVKDCLVDPKPGDKSAPAGAVATGSVAGSSSRARPD